MRKRLKAIMNAKKSVHTGFAKTAEYKKHAPKASVPKLPTQIDYYKIDMNTMRRQLSKKIKQDIKSRPQNALTPHPQVADEKKRYFKPTNQEIERGVYDLSLQTVRAILNGFEAEFGQASDDSYSLDK